MADTAARPSRPTWGRWLTVSACWVVCLIAPFDLDTVVQVLDHAVPPPLPVAVLGDAENNDEEDNLLTPGSAPECRRDVRKQPRLSGAFALPQGRLGGGRTHFHSSGRLATRPGGQHAFRNGCGTPLLC
jgi:hypothetical protein